MACSIRVCVRMAAALALCAVFGLAAAGRASAQGYSIYADCNRSEGWSTVGDANYGAYRTCEGGWLGGLRTLVTPSAGSGVANGSAAFSFAAPGGTKIVGLQWSGSKYHGVSSAGWIGGGWALRTGMFGDNFRNIDSEAECYTHNYGACFSGAASDPNAKSIPDHHVGGLNEGVIGFYTQCTPLPNNCPVNSDGMAGHNFTRAALVVSKMRVDLRDDVDPSVGALVGTDGWHRGVMETRFDAADNSGVSRTAIRTGADSLVADQPHGCDWYRLKPCPDLWGGDGTHVIDTRNLTDGHHVVVPEAWDAAGRWTRGTWVDLYVDNTAPNAPAAPSLDGGEAWSTSNSRTMRWAQPGGQAAPIVGSRIVVCKTGTSDCRTRDSNGTVATGDIGGFAGPGDYTARASLRDAAGNHNPEALSDGVHVRFDNVAPGAADPKQANGWLNAAERSTYQQSIKLADREFKPVSGIGGYSVTVNGGDPDETIEASGESVDYPPAGLVEGVNTIKARSVSGAGVGSAAVKAVDVRVDLSKPSTVVRNAPADGHWQRGPVDLVLAGLDQPNLSGMSPGDPTRPVEEGAYIAYRIDGGDLQKVRGAEAPVTVADEGEHTITYYAVDVAGNESDPKTVTVKIDRSAPTASATSDAVDSQQWQRESVTVGLSGDDGAGRSGMDAAPTDRPVEDGAYLAYRLDSANLERVRGGSATFRVDGDGDHVVSYYAVDSAGNASEQRELRFRVDKTAPHQVFFEHQSGDKRRLEVVASDVPSGVRETQVGLRRVGAIAESSALKRLARKDPSRYRTTKLRGTRQIGNRPVDCRRKRAAARRPCLDRRRAQLVRHRIASLGSGWRMLAATREGDKWIAEIPKDESLVEGVYQLQAVAQDQAGNESSGDRFRNGQPAIVPISEKDQLGCCHTGAGAGPGIGIDGTIAAGDLGTIDTKITAGAVERTKMRVKVSKKCRKPKSSAQKRRCAKAGKPKYRDRLVDTLKVRYGAKATIKGNLTTAAGAPVADGAIDVIDTPKADGHVARIVGAVTSDRTGAFTYTAPAGSSRSVTFRFRGLGDYRRSEGTVSLLVPGAVTLKPSKRRVANRQSVMFKGKILSRPLPSRGKVVDLQVFYRHKWRTFATPRANAKGQFKFRYRFEATRSTTTYRFRARVRPESAYPYELGYSKVVSVRVRGR